MATIKILDSELMKVTVDRLAHQLVENHDDFANSVMLGLQPKGIFLAERIKTALQSQGLSIPLGYLDTTFYRDDFRRQDAPLKPNATKVPFIIEDKKVILVDDVLYTGRSVRAAMSAMMAFGRPSKVELLVMIDRKYSRHIPVSPDYVGRSVNSIQSQRVKVQWKEQGHEKDEIWLVNE